jgi:hypothetical protein
MIALYIIAALCLGAACGFCWREIIALASPRYATAPRLRNGRAAYGRPNPN